MTLVIQLTRGAELKAFAETALACCNAYQNQGEQTHYGMKILVPEELKGHRGLLRNMFLQCPFLFVDKVRLRVEKSGELWLTLQWSKKS